MKILRPGDSECVEIERLRANIVRTQAEIRNTSEAPWPRAHRAVLLRAELQRIVDSSTDTRHRFAKVVDPVNDAAAFPALDWPLALDLFGIDRMQKLISERIDQLDLADGLAPAERAQRLRVLDASLFEQEVGEELAICALERTTGAHVLRRVNVNPAAVAAAWTKAAA